MLRFTFTLLVVAFASGCGAPDDNKPPVAVDDTATTFSGAFIVIDVIANDRDVDGVTFKVTSVTRQGTMGSAKALEDGTVQYEARAGVSGTDRFEYEIDDDLEDGTATGVVEVTILPLGLSLAPKADFATGTNPHGLVFADFNADGKPDAAASNIEDHTLSVLGGSTTPMLSGKSDFAVGRIPLSVASGDLNGDNKPDIATGDFDDDTVSVLLNTTPTSASPPTFSAVTQLTCGESPHHLAIGDLDGDGKPEIVTANFMSHTVSVLENATTTGAASPTFLEKVDFPTATFPVGVAIGDLNGDDRPDLAVTSFGEDKVSILLNTTAPGAKPTFADKLDFGTGKIPVSIVAADLNGDGTKDLAIANFGGDTVTVLMNMTAPRSMIPLFAAKVDLEVGEIPFALALGDLNKDGAPDLVVSSVNDNTFWVMLNLTAPQAIRPTFATLRDVGVGHTPLALALADVDGDGGLDIAAANLDDSSVSVVVITRQ